MTEFEFETGPWPFPGLDRDGVEAIHEASMRIVEELGVALDHERARAVFEANGADVDDEGVVTVPRDVVEDCVERAPASFTLHARNPDRTVTVGGDGPPVRAPAHGPRNVRTPESRRRARLSDHETFLKLAQVEDVITCTGYRPCEPGDVPGADRPYRMLRRALTLTDQPVLGPANGAAPAEACMEMVGIAVDDPELRRPYVAGLVNTVPPRSIDTAMLDGLLTYAEHGQPPIVSSFTVAGASGPPSLAASMAQTNAENLVGIALAQLVNPGTPVVYGVPSSNVDARYGSLSIGSPESALFVSLAARMARYYDLPSRAGGGLSDAKAVDYQSGFESAFVQAVTDFSGVDYVLHAAGVLESYSAVSAEKFVLDCEALRYLDRFRSGESGGASLDAALDAMAETPPAGHFADESSGTGFFRPEVVDKRSHADWQADGGESAAETAADRVRDRLDEYERPPIAADVERELERYVEEHTGPA